MAKSLRLSEKWFRRGLWLVAFVFAGFLIGLGGTVVRDLPKVEQTLTVDQFVDKHAARQLRAEISITDRQGADAQTALDQARLKQQSAEAATASEREKLSNWLATRRATQQADQDPEVIARTRGLDTLRQTQRQAEVEVERQQQAALDAQQARTRAQQQLQQLEASAAQKLQVAQRRAELCVFLYRLALTLPLLVLSGWLLKKHRQSTYWPFVWGFVFFAVFAFFVELVPYLPSYGGYVRYIVGIAVTVIVGRQAIIALNRYLERQRLAEQQPDARRRVALGYDTALARLAKGVCPGCERPIELKNEAVDYCPHCGICVFDRCAACQTRKNAFARYCHACGTPPAPVLTRPEAAPAGIAP